MDINFLPLLNNLPYASAAIVSFGRRLNDTPKLVSLLLITQLFHIPGYISILAIVITVGGLLNAKKVAATMSMKISKFNHGQGFTANLITGDLVIMASKFRLPVSTTHITVGSIYGIGLVKCDPDNLKACKHYSNYRSGWQSRREAFDAFINHLRKEKSSRLSIARTIRY